MSDPFNLGRFVEAQNPVYEQVCAELRAGSKRSHWMWFVFPQIQGLGHSPTAKRYAISSLDEARAYLDHSVLGPRLRECTQLITDVSGRSIDEILGFPDDMKFRSSMTLFAHAAPNDDLFKNALHKFFGDEYDPLTVGQIRSSQGRTEF